MRKDFKTWKTQKRFKEYFIKKGTHIRFWDENHIAALSYLSRISSYNVYGFHHALIPDKVEIRIEYLPEEQMWLSRFIDFRPRSVHKYNWDHRVLLEIRSKSFKIMKKATKDYYGRNYYFNVYDELEVFKQSGVAHFKGYMYMFHLYRGEEK